MKNKYYINGENVNIILKETDEGDIETIVSKESLEKLQEMNITWQYNSVTGYAQGYYKGKTVYLHRIVMDAGADQVSDHRHGNKLDNRLSELRLVSYSENSRGHRKMNKKNTTGAQNVYKSGKYFRVIFTEFGKQKYLGTYKEIEKAIEIAEDYRVNVFANGL